jgi:hypothetical protein
MQPTIPEVFLTPHHRTRILLPFRCHRCGRRGRGDWGQEPCQVISKVSGATSAACEHCRSSTTGAAPLIPPPPSHHKRHRFPHCLARSVIKSTRAVHHLDIHVLPHSTSALNHIEHRLEEIHSTSHRPRAPFIHSFTHSLIHSFIYFLSTFHKQTAAVRPTAQEGTIRPRNTRAVSPVLANTPGPVSPVVESRASNIDPEAAASFYRMFD